MTLGSWDLAIGDCDLGVGNWVLAIGSRQLGVGNWVWAMGVGSSVLAIGRRA